MDKSIRRNEICIVGLPRCDFVFSSTRSCFIAYGFKDSPLEMTILRQLLEQRGIEAVEAGGMRAPGQHAFCAKICSKIITAQFCIVLLNNEVNSGREIPNANVNMEYGLVLGFNKYVIPFQRESQTLPFNVAGLDTVKYTDQEFPRLAADAIDAAIAATTQESIHPVALDQVLGTFLLAKRTLITPINNPGEKAFFDLGASLGFNLLNDLAGFQYIFFGNFTALRAESIVWRIRLLGEIVDARRSTLEAKVGIGVATVDQAVVAEILMSSFQIWVVTTGADDRQSILDALATQPSGYAVEVFSLDDVRGELEKLGGWIT
jgi:hypothetical protein